MTSPAMTMGRTGRKMVTQHGSLGRRALAKNSSSDAIADEDVDSYADMVYELYGLPIWGRIQRKFEKSLDGKIASDSIFF